MGNKNLSALRYIEARSHHPPPPADGHMADLGGSLTPLTLIGLLLHAAAAGPRARRALSLVPPFC